MTNQHTVNTLPKGTVIETLTSEGVPTGNVYKLGPVPLYQTARREAWKNYRQGKGWLYHGVRCRVMNRDGCYGEPWQF